MNGTDSKRITRVADRRAKQRVRLFMVVCSWLRVCGLETVNAGCVACLFCVLWLGGFNAPRCGPWTLFIIHGSCVNNSYRSANKHTHPHTGRKAFEIRDYLTKLSPEIATQLPERKSSSKKR